ncbi:MAG TPA: hypothetical protein VHM72_05410 [Solirubrobacteraceae bacterium]|nr:hypothetical protein [Solirubrobacteraceae bacterium]
MRYRLQHLLWTLFLTVAASGVLLALAGVAASQARSAGSGCGAATSGVVDQIDDGIAHQIYNGELMSAEVSADLYRITSSTALASAVAGGNPATIRAATHAIVYTPVWHIVRLRVLSSSGQLLADVGGPYVLAPVSGQISYQGKVVGSFVMSVQDDLGYKKLVSHIAGIPIEEYLHGEPLLGTLTHPPSSPPASGPLTLRHTRYDVDSYTVGAFPAGGLQIAVLVPAPSASFSAMSCQAVRLATNAAIVDRVAVGLMLSGHNIYANQRLFVSQAYGYVHLPIFMFDGTREAFGTNRLEGASAPAPGALAKSGKVSYDGSKWLVTALRPFPPDWIYVLEPTSVSATTGATGTTSS